MGGQDAGWVDQVSYTPGAPTLAEALDTPGWSWVTGGNPAAWEGQTVVTHDGVDAARSGAIGDSQATWRETTVNGAGTLALSGNNSYGPATGGTAGTVLSGGGTLQVGGTGTAPTKLLALT